MRRGILEVLGVGNFSFKKVMTMIYERIRNLREDRDLPQRELAAYLQVSQNTYSQYENGVIWPSAENAVRLALFYGTSVDYLPGLTDEKTPYPRRNASET